jgi:hypothetical protein
MTRNRSVVAEPERVLDSGSRFTCEAVAELYGGVPAPS